MQHRLSCRKRRELRLVTWFNTLYDAPQHLFVNSLWDLPNLYFARKKIKLQQRNTSERERVEQQHIVTQHKTQRFTFFIHLIAFSSHFSSCCHQLSFTFIHTTWDKTKTTRASATQSSLSVMHEWKTYEKREWG